jgi:hypothetical protein
MHGRRNFNREFVWVEYIKITVNYGELEFHLFIWCDIQFVMSFLFHQILELCFEAINGTSKRGLAMTWHFGI